MKYYIATSTTRINDHNLVRDHLKKLGHEITYDWTTHGSVRETSLERLQEVAHAEFEGILEADFVVVLLPGGKGTHAELGFSIGVGKRVFIQSESPALFQLGPLACAFYHHKDVIRFCFPISEIAEKVHAEINNAVSVK